MELTLRKIIVIVLVIFVAIFLFPNILNIQDITSSGVNSAKKYRDQETYFMECDAFGKHCKYVLEDCSNKEKQEENDCSQKEIETWKAYMKVKDCIQEDCDDEEEDEWEKFVSEYIDKEKTDSSQGKTDEYDISDSEELEQGDLPDEKEYDKIDIQAYSKSPYGVTALGETGSADNPIKTVSQIVVDTGGSHSYGNLGLNSNGGAVSFWREYKDCLGLEGTPGTEEADESWREVAQNNPEELVIAEIEWYNKHVINPSVNAMTQRNFPEEIYSNPQVVTYLADVTIQMGDRLRDKLLDKIQPQENENAKEYLERLAEYQSSDEYLYSAFNTYLSEHPERIDALKNRVLDKRLPESQRVEIAKMKMEKQCTLS